MKNYSNRQTKTKIYREDTGLTCVTRASLIRKRKRIGNSVKLIVNDNTETMIIYIQIWFIFSRTNYKIF